jgi:hypothetical protein
VPKKNHAKGRARKNRTTLSMIRLKFFQMLIYIILEEDWRRFLSLGLLPPCAEAIKTASAPNSGRGQNSLIAQTYSPRFPLRLVLSLCGGVKGRSLSKIPPSNPII